MKYVLDANVAIKWVIDEDHSDRARRLRDAYRQGMHQLLAPDVFPTECAYALFKMEFGRKIIPSGKTGLLLASLLIDRPQLESSWSLLPRAAAICAKLRGSFYDCLYIALAEQEGCEFITADDRLVKNGKGNFPFLLALSDLPQF